MIFSANHAFQVYYKVYLWKVYHEYISYHGSMTMTLDSDKTSFYFDQASSSNGYITLKITDHPSIQAQYDVGKGYQWICE